MTDVVWPAYIRRLTDKYGQFRKPPISFSEFLVRSFKQFITPFSFCAAITLASFATTRCSRCHRRYPAATASWPQLTTFALVGLHHAPLPWPASTSRMTSDLHPHADSLEKFFELNPILV
jgi:hypothetical protein